MIPFKLFNLTIHTSLLIFISSFFVVLNLYAQNTNVKSNSLINVTQDSVVADTTAKIIKKSDIESVIDYHAKDSMRFDVTKQTMFLFGKAIVTYGDMKLEAARIEVNWKNNIVKAYGIPDSTGYVIGLPVFTEKTITYNADSITYNFKTEKGIISGIVTEQNGGFIVGEKVKKTPDDNFYIRDALYTTCNLKNPHFGIRSRKLKTVVGKYVISGPFNLELNHVPTPLAFPLGLFPFSDKRSSGIIIPSYGESAARGFYLRDGGFYWAVNNYIGAKFTGQLYSIGGFGININTTYKNRYHYNGNFDIRYNKVVRESDDLTDDITKDFWLRWSHRPESKGSGRFSANVNIGTSTYNQNNSFNIQNYTSASFNSNISYSKTFGNSPFSLGTSIRHNQNVTSKIFSVSPSVNVSMRRINPFKKKNSSKKNILTQLVVAYTGNARGDLNNTPLGSETDTLDFFSNISTLLDRMKYGAQHKIPVSTSFTVLKHLTITPNLNYTSTWHQRKLNYSWQTASSSVVVDTTDGFYTTYSYSTGASMSTRLYAFYYLKGGTIIRHQLTPTVGFSFAPDFSEDKYGVYDRVRYNENGDTRLRSRYSGSLFSGPSSGVQKNVNFSLGNQLEMKVRSKDDDDGYKKITLISNASIRSSYNFAADSFKLANITFNLVSKLFKNINISINGTINPYTYILESYDPETGHLKQTRSKVLAWQNGNGLGELSRIGIALNTSFSPIKTKRQEEKKEKLEKLVPELLNNPSHYVDFDIPWKLSLSYTYNYNKRGFLDAITVQNLKFNGELQLTRKWKVSGSTSYDFKKKDFSFTSLNIFRDLHCWQMSLSWVPFGLRQSYNIDIRVNSSILQDLKINKRNSWYDR